VAKLNDVAELKFRNERLEIEFIAYAIRKDPLIIQRVQEDWFANEAYRNIVSVIKDVKAIMPRSALMASLNKLINEDDADTYQEIVKEIYTLKVTKINPKSVEIHIQEICDLFESRKILSGISDIVSSVRANKFDLSRTKTQLKEMSAGAALPQDAITGNYVDGFESRLEAIKEKMKQYEEGQEVGITTGIRLFDQWTGGLQPPEFGVIGGQPGVGKTATLGSFGIHAWENNNNVLMITGEMSKLDVEYRFDSDLADIPAIKFRRGTLRDEDIDKWEKMIEKKRSINEAVFEVVSFSHAFTAEDIHNVAVRLQDLYEKEFNLILIDYLNIMAAVGGGNKRYGMKNWEAQSQVVWDVKNLCAELNGGVCCWSAGQLIDDAIDAEILSLKDFKYARAIAETAPIAIGLVRSQNDDAENIMQMQVLKLRSAPLPTRAIILHPNLEYMRINEELEPREKNILFMEESSVSLKKKKQNGKYKQRVEGEE